MIRRLVAAALLTFGAAVAAHEHPAAMIPHGGAAPPFSPTQIPGLVMWLRADLGCYSDAGSTPCTNGASIQQWNDQSGNANNCSQSNAANRPTYVANAVNGKATTAYSGSQFVTCPAVTPINQNYTKIAVIKPASLTPNNNILSGNASGAFLLAGTAYPVLYHGSALLFASTQAVDTSHWWSVLAASANNENLEGFTSTEVAYATNGIMAGTAGYYPPVPNTDTAANAGAFNAMSEFDGDIAEMLMVGSLVNGANANGLNQYFNNRYGTAFSLFTKMVAFHGDSITVGYLAATGQNYADISCAGHIGVSYCMNVSTGGTQLHEMNAQAVSYVDPLVSPGLDNIDVVFAGTNDLFVAGYTAAQTYAVFQTYCANRHAAGWKVVAVTMLPRGSGSQTQRDSFNTMLRADTCRDALADPAGNATIGCDGCASNTTYYNGDEIHPNATGQAIVAPYVYAAINTL